MPDWTVSKQHTEQLQEAQPSKKTTCLTNPGSGTLNVFRSLKSLDPRPSAIIVTLKALFLRQSQNSSLVLGKDCAMGQYLDPWVLSAYETKTTLLGALRWPLLQMRSQEPM